MAYALIAWDMPGASTDDLASVEAEFDRIGTIRFFAGLRLLQEDGPSWVDVMQKVYGAVRANPGLEAMVIMPAKGARVGGWTSANMTAGELTFARNCMNMDGSDTNPVLFRALARMASFDGGDPPPDDWRRALTWAAEGRSA
jgi:hypothetical protein